jgi:hypothetical protein
MQKNLGRKEKTTNDIHIIKRKTENPLKDSKFLKIKIKT